MKRSTVDNEHNNNKKKRTRLPPEQEQEQEQGQEQQQVPLPVYAPSPMAIQVIPIPVLPSAPTMQRPMRATPTPRGHSIHQIPPPTYSLPDQTAPPAEQHKHRSINAERIAKCRAKKADLEQHTVEIPTTPGLARNPKPRIDLEKDAVVWSTSNEVLIRLWKNVLSERHVKTLYSWTTHLLGQHPELKSHATVRGDERTGHVGCWRKRMQEIQVTAFTRSSPAAQNWARANEQLFKKVGKLFHELAPVTYDKYQAVVTPIPKLGGVFACSAINFNWGKIGPHYDEDDYEHGFCFVVTCGNYTTGGVLHFLAENVYAHTQPGDVIAFRSKRLFHQVSEYDMDRYSVVLFTNHECFFPLNFDIAVHSANIKQLFCSPIVFASTLRI